MLEITGTPVRASSGAMSSSVLKPPHDNSNESAPGADGWRPSLFGGFQGEDAITMTKVNVSGVETTA